MFFFKRRWQRAQRRGDALLLEGKWPEAVAAYRESVALNADEPWTHNGLAVALLKSGELEEAVSAYQRAVSLKPDLTESWVNLGGALLQLDRWEDAAEAYQRAIALDPEIPDAFANLGVARLRQERWEECASAYAQCLTLVPGNLSARRYMALALARLERWEDAASAYEAYLAMDPRCAELPGGGAEQSPDDGEPEARTEYGFDERELCVVHNAFGDVLAEAGHWKRSEEILRKGIGYCPESPEAGAAFASLAWTLAEQGRDDEAEAAFAEAEQLEAYSEALYTRLGEVELRRGNTEEAIDAFVRAVILAPRELERYHRLGAALIEVGRPGDAAIVYEQAVAQGVGDGTTHAKLALAAEAREHAS